MSQDSPCIGICEIDESGYCVGCGRSARGTFGGTGFAAGDQDVATEVLTPVAGTPADASG